MSCSIELMDKYKDELEPEKLQTIIDSVADRLDDGSRLGPGQENLKSRLMYEFKKEAHRLIRAEVDTIRLKKYVNKPEFVAAREKFIKEVMPDLESPDPKVRAKAEKAMKKLNLFAPIEAKASGLSQAAEAGNIHYKRVQQQLEAEYLNSLEVAVGAENMKVIMGGDFDIDIAKAMVDLQNNKPLNNYPDPVKKAAMGLHKLNKAMVEDLSKVGVWIPERKNYISRQTHEAGKIMDIGKNQWIDDLLKEGVLDNELTFGGKTDLEARKEILEEIYEDIIDGSYGQTSVGNFTGARNIHFATPESFVKYNKSYGKGSLLSTAASTARSASKQYARTDLFGLEPKKGVQTMHDEITKGFSKAAKNLYNDSSLLSGRRNIENQLNEVMGDMEYPVSTSKTVNFLRTTRTMLSASMLKFSVFSTFTDLSFGKLIGTSGFHIDRIKGIGDFAKKFTNSKDRKYWAARLDMYFGEFASLSDKYGANSGQSGGAVDRAYRKYVMPLNGMELQNASAKVTWGHQLALSMGTKYADKSFGELDARQVSTLKRYDISEADWEKIRKTKHEIEPGVYTLDPQAIKIGTQDRTLARKFAVLLNDMAREIGSPEAGVKETSMVTQGLKQGSVEREFALTLGQFKSFAFTIPKIFKRVMNNNPNAKPFELKNLMEKETQGEMKMLGMFMAEMTMVSAAALTARSAITQGETTDFSDPEATASFFIEAAQRGAMPMFSSYLIDVAKGEYAQFGRSMFKDLAGPTVSEVDKMIKVLSGVTDKDSPTFLQGGELILKYLPGTQLTFLAPLGLKSFAQQLKEMQRPGYMDRLERRKKKEGTIKPEALNPFR